MKKLLLLLTMLFAFNISNAQFGTEFQVYHSVTEPYNRTIFKALKTFESLKGKSHFGIHLENFQLGGEPAIGAYVEFGYAFTDFKLPMSIAPLCSIGYMWYDGYRHMKLNLGVDLSYKIGYHFDAHLLFTTAQENWMERSPEFNNIGIEHTKRRNILSLGISYSSKHY